MAILATQPLPFRVYSPTRLFSGVSRMGDQPSSMLMIVTPAVT